MTMLLRILTLFFKELLAILRDKRGRVVLIVPPVIQLVVFSNAATQEARNLALGVTNRDGGRYGRELVERFQAASTFTEIVPLRGESEIDAALDEQRVIAVLVVPEDFSRDIANGKPAEAQFLLDGRKTNTSQIALGYAQRIAQTFEEEEIPNAPSAPAKLVVRNWFNKNLDFKWYTVPSLICILSTLIGLLVTSLSVAREREMGTFDQLLVSPLQPIEILIGKAGAALLLAVGEGTLILTAAVAIFHIPFAGSLALLYASMTVFLLSIIGVGLFISALSSTQQQAILGTFTFMTPAILLSGFATPIENMPDWLQPITLANPLRWFLVVVRGVFLKAMPAGDVMANTWPMACIAVVTLGAAAVLFRRRLE